MDHSETFLFSEVFCGTPPSCLKVMGGGGWWVVGGLQDFSVSPSPLLGLIGVETGLDWVCFVSGGRLRMSGRGVGV